MLGQRGKFVSTSVKGQFFFTFAFIIVIAHFNSAFNSACSVKIHLRIKIIHIYTKVTQLIFVLFVSNAD